MTRVLVVNHNRSPVCGIHALGVRVADALGAVHVDCGSLEAYDKACAEHAPDAVIVNYRQDLTPWWRSRRDGRPVLAVAHNYSASTVRRVADGLLGVGFDRVLVLDPLLRVDHPGLRVTGRPIPDAAAPCPLGLPPRVGSFGFAFAHKGFDSVVGEVCDTLDDAVVDLHTPEAYFNGANGADLHRPAVVDACRRAVTKPGVRLHQTWDHVAPRQLVDRLASNHVNCLLYHPGQPDAGQSSALDFLIAARRPILVSEADMFRTGHGHVAVWPKVRLRHVLDHHQQWQRHADALYSEQHGRLAADVETVLADLL